MLFRVCLSFLAAVCLLPSAFGSQSVANIISIQGTGQFKPDEKAEWSAARVEQDLLAGHFIRTGEFSRMGVLFRDRTQLRLNEKTVLRVKEAVARTTVRLEIGRAWTQSKTLPDMLYMETPSATAAIRGTDWDIEVDASGRAVLTVLSGEVEFFNELGRLVLKQNESAEARIGRAPTKLIFVRPRDRVQWVTSYAVVPLQHISLSGRQLSELDQALTNASRTEKGRILADLGRWHEAETAFAAVPGAAADLVGAGYASLRRGKPGEARAHFDRAGVRDGWDAELLALGRASVLVISQQFSRAFAELTALTRAPRLAQPAAFLLLADLMIFGGDLERATVYLQQGLKQFPRDPRLHSLLARTYLIADERGKSRDEIASARRLEEQSLDASLAEGDLARIEGDPQAAAKAYQQAIAVKPADDRGWYGLGRVNTEKEEVREGRSHLLKALELNPLGPGYQGELGTLESFANNFAEARRAFEAALAQNPDDYVALTGLGLLELKRGNTDVALDAFLRAGLMEPRYARAHIYTAVAYYQTGHVQQALDELDRASQLDEKDPLPHLLASIIYTDTLRPGLAIESSRRALRLLPYLKSLNQLANDQQGLTNLGQAFAFLGMEEWALRYAQDSYYPFWAGSHLFLADRYPGLFTKNSELFQGFLSDPTVFGGSTRFQTLIPRPGSNVSASMRVTTARNLVHGTSPNITANGFSNSTVPVAFFADLEHIDLKFIDGPFDRQTATVALGVTPRHDFGFFLFGDRSRLNSDLITSSVDLRDELDAGRADIGLHYKLSPSSQVWFKAGEFSSSDHLAGTLNSAPVVSDVKVRQPEWGLRHTFSANDRHEVTWGVEAGHRKTSSDFDDRRLAPFILTLLDYDYRERSVDAYVSDRWRVSRRLLVHGDIFYQRHRRTADYAESITFFGFPVPASTERESFSHSRINPRLGLVYRFDDDGPQLRLAYQRWLRPALFSSLGPVATAGIPLDDRLVMRGGELERVRGQIEWEISKRNFVSAHLDYKKVDNNRFSLTPFALNELESLQKLRPRRFGSLANDDMLEFVNTPEYDGGTSKSGGVSFNHLLTDKWGVFGRYVGTTSKNTGFAFAGNQVPYLPRHIVAAGATWASPEGWYFISRMVYRSSRYKDEANTISLAPGWSGAFDLYWQSRDKTWLFRLSADNAFDKNNSTQYTAEVNIRF